MNLARPETKAYTLRLSRTAATGAWRVTLYSAQTGERQYFATLAQLYEFLDRATEESPTTSNAQDTPPATSCER